MRREFVSLAFFVCILGLCGICQATTISLAELKTSVEIAYDQLREVEYQLGSENPLGLAAVPRADFGATFDIPDGNSRNFLISLLQGYRPDPSYNSDYQNNQMTLLGIFLTSDGGAGYGSKPYDIPDLSTFTFDRIFLTTSFTPAGNATLTDAELFAEVTPVPEPGTIALLITSGCVMLLLGTMKPARAKPS
jgi:hypothetical protein